MNAHRKGATRLIALAAGLGLWTACDDAEPLVSVPLPRTAAPGVIVGDTAPRGGPDAFDGVDDDGFDATPPPVDEECHVVVDANAVACDALIGTWVATRGTLQDTRVSPTATKLLDGRVLVVGGFPNRPVGGGPTLATAEVYDPATDAFTSTEALHRARAGHTASLLDDGSVLVIGGITSMGDDGSFVALRDAERWDPATGHWSLLGDVLPAPRAHHAADVLANGRVMLRGGMDLGRTFDVDIVSSSGATAGATTRIMPAQFAQAVRIGEHALRFGYQWRTANIFDGSDAVLGIVDVQTGEERGQLLAHARLMEQATTAVRVDGATHALLVGIDPDDSDDENPWGRPVALIVDDGVERETRTPPLSWRTYPTAATLLDGRALLAGGMALDGTRLSGELFDPVDETFVATCPMVRPRELAASVVLDDGSVLVVGGTMQCARDNVAERFVPGAR